jgi:hypothetical protein
MAAGDYYEEQAAYNLTIQHAVAASIDGVSPDQVTDITVSNSAAAVVQRNQRSVPLLAGSCFLSYTLNVYDPLLTFDTMKAQLIEATSSGKMDENLHMYAAEFGVEELLNCNFGVPEVLTTAAGDSASSSLTDAETTIVTICIVLGVALLVALVQYARRKFGGRNSGDDDEVKKKREKKSRPAQVIIFMLPLAEPCT